MAKESFLDRPWSQVRRKDRRLDDETWQQDFLHTAPYGHLAIAWQDEPTIHTNLFWYDNDAIYLHQARVGKLRAILDQGSAPACFTVAEIGRILPNYTPLEFSVEYASVLVYGQIDVVAGLDNQRYALEGLMEKYSPQLTAGEDYDPMPDGDIRQTSVHKITIEQIVAKANIKPDDYIPEKIPPYDLPGESFIERARAQGVLSIGEKELS